MSMPRTVRRMNETRLVEALFRSGAMSRADLARALGLTRATAGNLVAGLAEEGLLLEGEKAAERKEARTGRPGGEVRLNPDYAIFLGADIGVGQLTVIALDTDATLVSRYTVGMLPRDREPGDVVNALAELVRTATGQLRKEQIVRGLAVTIPGLMDYDGHVLRAPILGWKAVPLGQLMALALPEFDSIRIENDANASAFAEIYRELNLSPGGANGISEATYLFMDSGVGGGILANGGLITGYNGYAGELGHILVGESGFGPLLTLKGALESFVGREAILSRYRHHGGNADDFASLLAALRSGDEAAQATFEDCVFYLARGLATLTSVLNPAKFVLGGAVATFFSHDPELLKERIQENLLPGHPLAEVQFSPLGSDGPAIGAACLMHQTFFAFESKLVRLRP